MLWMLPLKRYFQFSGRSGRAEYWQYIVALVAAYIVVLLLAVATASGDGSDPLTLFYLLVLATIVPTYAVTFRRLHDRNQSGWLVGGLFMLNGISLAITSIRAGITSSVLAAPFVLASWLVVALTLALSGYLLFEACQPGDAGPNRYGPPPHLADAAEQAALQTSLNAAGERVRAATGSPSQDDSVDQLERLSKLRASGALTDAEFEEQKAALLGRL